MTRMHGSIAPILAVTLVIGLTACGSTVRRDDVQALAVGVGPRTTGSVDVAWMGGRGSGATETEAKASRAELSWMDGLTGKADRGVFEYVVTNADGTLHRQIVAKVTDDPSTGVVVDVPASDGRFLGIVTYDSKTTGETVGGGCEDGEEGCDGEHEEGGCENGEEGCDGDHEEGGCENGEEGCGGDHEEGGCSGGGGSGHPSGSTSRVGQKVAVTVHDGGTPGTAGDAIAWSWFIPDAAPSLDEPGSWPALCAKPILGGNLKVLPASPR